MLTELERLTTSLADRYRIERELGRGGMATVYLATDLRHDRQVAVKVLLPELAHTLGADRFLREIKLTARLDHPSILPLLDSGTAGEFLYYVMPYADGESLRDRLAREKQLPVAEALQIAREVGDALGYAHARGIVHRDVKPANILLSAGHARVADFGIARAITAACDETLTATGLAIGTATYMSPEQAAGAKEVDGRSDLYSLACVLYEMLAGDPPFTGTSPQALMARKSVESARPLRTVRPSVPDYVERAVLMGLAPVPADRHATVETFVEALDRSEPVPAPRRVATDHRRVLAALVLLALVAGGSLVLHLAARESPDATTSPTRIAVFPFAVEDQQIAYLREGVMDFLAHAIDGAGEVRRVDPNVLLSRLPNDDVADLGTARRVASELGAGRFLLGRVVRSGQSVRILASLYKEGDASEERHFMKEGRLDSVSLLIDALARDLLLFLPTGAGTWVTEASAPVGGGATAIREYSRGEALMRRFKADSAAIAFRKAVAADSTFALGWLRLSFAENFRTDDLEMVTAIDRAMHFAERLGPRDRMLAEVVYRHHHGDPEGAERAALALVSTYPEYAEGWYRLGVAQLWSAWRVGRSPLHAEEAFQNALSLDSGHRQVLYALLWMAALDGRRARVSSLSVRVEPPTARIPEDSAALPAFLDSIVAMPTAAVIDVINRSAWNTKDDLQIALRFAAILTDSARRSDEDRRIGHILRGRIMAASGRWTDAEEAFRDADASGASVGLLEAAWIAGVPLSGVSAEARLTLRDSLQHWSPSPHYAVNVERTYPFQGSLILDPWILPYARDYAVGLLSAGLGDAATARRSARSLQTAAEPADSIGLLTDLSLEIEAMLAMQRSDTSAALALLNNAGLKVASHYAVTASPFHMRPVNRLLRAAAHSTDGRDREALGWYASFAYRIDTPEWVFLAGTSLRQGELYERLGEPTRAAYHYRRFLARWQNADPAHQPLVQDVRRRVDRLEREAK